MQVNVPDLDAMLRAFPWKASLVLSRCTEWREIYKNRDQLELPLLDLGCGNGVVTRLIYGNQCIAGIDIDRNELKKAQSVLPGVVQGDARYLPYANESFNSVASICVIEHLPEIDRCLTEIARVLRPGGTFIATVPSCEWKELFFWNRVLSMIGLKRWGRKLADAYDKELVHLNLLSKSQWQEKFSRAGLELEPIDAWLDQRATGFVSLVDSVSALPFPFPGFWTKFGTHYFLVGVLKRLGGKRWWHERILKMITSRFDRPPCKGEKSGGYVLIARKPTQARG